MQDEDGGNVMTTTVLSRMAARTAIFPATRCWRNCSRLGSPILRVLAVAIVLALRGELLAGAPDDWDAEGHIGRAAAEAQFGRFDVEVNICDGQGAEQAKKKAESILTLRLNSLERAGGLSKPQVEKLRMAGENDIAAFFRRVDALKDECEQMNVNDQQFQKMWPKISAMRQECHNGFFGEKSLFDKVLQGMLRSNPSAPYQEQERQRREFRRRATIELAVVMFETGVPLTESQHQKFLGVLFKELQPPKSFGTLEQYVIFYQASKLDEAKLKPIFDDRQWAALSGLLRNAKNMEPHLKSQGFVP